MDPDIRLGGQFNMFPSISCLLLRWRGAKSIAKLDGGTCPDLSHLDPPLRKNCMGYNRGKRYKVRYDFLAYTIHGCVHVVIAIHRFQKSNTETETSTNSPILMVSANSHVSHRSGKISTSNTYQTDSNIKTESLPISRPCSMHTITDMQKKQNTDLKTF